MIRLLILLFLTWDPFTLILNYMNPCECFSYKHSSCFLMCYMNFYDHRSQLSPYSFQRIWKAPLIRETQSVLQTHHLPEPTWITALILWEQYHLSAKIVRQKKVLNHLKTSYKYKRSKFWKSSNVFHYQVCLALCNIWISLKIPINELF